MDMIIKIVKLLAFNTKTASAAMNIQALKMI